jgi:DNA-binding transcriptional ArsR family regulator
MFRSEHILVPLYDAISRQAVLAADAPRVAGFLGKKITPTLAQEIGSRLSTRIEGRCIKHYMGAAGVKVYDKFSRVLRVETTVNDVSFFKHHRKVEHKGAAATRELAPLKKSIYSLIDLREILLGCNQRYLAFLSSLDDPSAGERDLQRLSQPRVGAQPSIKGLNFFDATDHQLLRTLQHGEFNIHGWRRADLVARLGMAPSAMTRQLRRLRGLGLIKKVTHTYRYYLTRLGRAAIAAACSLTRFNIVPAMAAAQ